MLSKFIYSQISSIAKMLNSNNWSDRMMDRAVDMLERLADRVEHLSGRISDNDGYSGPFDSAIDMEIGGSAQAAGEHTIASADLSAEITDTDNASIAVGNATFQAAAEGGAEFVTTDAYSNVSGADFVLSWTGTTSGKNWETTTTKVLAVDFAFYESNEPVIVAPDSDHHTHSYHNVADGNVATAEFDVTANAEDSLVDVYAGVLAIEDTYSGSAIDAFLAIG
ncbi:hypothetical protein IQ782_05065 [Salipiger pacificus]|uniref:Flagellin N-terminal domain-containing protein n=2 Tax=Salipiger mangrovisoli TaxID=2865933 RepID=A0ABR9WY51_9RHOB|nr:hypothetical protein [Salipiger mangrovisoli]